jgi:general secretion pathway protein I
MRRSQATSSSQAGFTLLEVLVALGILATSYVALLQTLSGSIRLSAYGRQVTVAAFLAQAKMELAEQNLIKDGFPVDSETKDGTFEDDGYPGYRWKLEVRKVELPIGEALNYLLSDHSGKDDKKSDTHNKASDGSPEVKALLSALGSAGGTGAMGAALGNIGGITEMLSKQMEEVLREMQLTVEWGEGGPGKRLVVTTHIVNMPQASGATGAQSPLPNPTGVSDFNISD